MPPCVSRRLSTLLTLLAITLGSGATFADEEESTWQTIASMFEINGYLENETAFGLHSPNHFSKVHNLFQLDIKGRLADWLDVTLLAWAMYDLAYDIYPTSYREQVRNHYRSNFTGDDVFQHTLREAYFDVYLDFMDIRLGRQQVVWGEAVGLRITDVVNPQDFREFILDDFVDSRIPLWMAKLDFYLSNWTFTVLWIPFFEPNQTALSGSDWEWTFNRPNVSPGLTVVTNDPDEPGIALENGEVGVRMAGLLGGWNLSASYLYTWDDTPTRHSNFDPATFSLTFDQRHHRTHVAGLTLANVFGPFVVHGELSHNIGKRFNTADHNDDDGVVEKQFLFYMLGVDYKISDYLLNLQFIQKVIFDHDDDMFEDQVQNFISLWVQAKYFNETLRPELLAIYGPNDGSWWIRPKLVYDFTDYLAGSLGADILIGGPMSFIGQFDENDRLFVELKYSF